MKVAYFAGSLVRNLDGVSRVLYKISDYNKDTGIDSVFISPDVDERIGNRTISLKGFRLPGYHEYKFSVSTSDYVQEQLASLNFTPDLVHVHSPCPAGLAGIRFARKNNIPVIATYHTHFISYLKYHKAGFLQPLVARYMRYFYNQCELVIVPSQRLKYELELLGISNVRVLPHGVDFTLFNKEYYSPALREAEGDKKILFYAGRLVKEKNLEVLAQAINKVAQRRQDFILWIAGTGNAEAALKQTMKNTTFFGFCDARKLSALYATAEIFIFPSATETFGNVTLEAMASSTACIVANSRGSADLIQNDWNGLLFDPENVEELVDCIEKLLNSENKRKQLAEAAYLSSQSYRWRTILDRQRGVYQEVTGTEPEHVREAV